MAATNISLLAVIMSKMLTTAPLCNARWALAKTSLSVMIWF